LSKIRVNIDGRECFGYDSQTIFEIARENGVDIPTLCHDDRVKLYGSCGICVVETEGNPKLLRSCSTLAANGMIIKTDSERVRYSRKTTLELLLSDHTGDCRPPCVLACPAQTDCQGYVGLIANGEYDEALKLIKEKIPLPASIGRVCPHPCEEACRRELVEEPIAIAAIKRFAGDMDIDTAGGLFTPDVGEPTGKSVAIVGGGPGGLTAAYFLRKKGHAVTIYDAMPHMGGMLRYGIPEYRLPKKLLQTEIDSIEQMGVTLKNNVRIGSDVTLDHLRRVYDAVIVAVGAWSSSDLRCPGEELDGVLGGIDFLRDVVLGSRVFAGRKVAVVGGGNTAMDASRTAVRLGAEAVYNVYRRTRNEMPAEEIEIVEADEEGVIFKNLTNPIEVVGENGKVVALRLQVMELGEPDASGRRAPVPVPGKEERLEVDTVIAAIGQKLAPAGLEGIELTKWGTISADESTFLTSLPGVFAIGDATNNGADIAISAIGDAAKAVDMVDQYLKGERLEYKEPYLVKSEKTAEDFADKQKQRRVHAHHRPANQRRGDFVEISTAFSKEEARNEASRCLECGCQDYFECKLLKYAHQYDVRPEDFSGAAPSGLVDETHPFIVRNPGKCILCGLCVRVCEEVVGPAALGLVSRGFGAEVKSALDAGLKDAGCIGCGMCVDMCPTGALTETMPIAKRTPLEERITETACSFCSVGCQTKLASVGNTLTRSLPAAERQSDAFLCEKGRFGFGEIARRKRLAAPLVKGEDGFIETSFEYAADYANRGLRALQARHGEGCVAVAISDRYTNEEAFLIKEYANRALHTDKVFSFGRVSGGLGDVLGRDCSTSSLDELDGTELIVLVEANLMKNHASAGMKVRRAAGNGVKLLVLGGEDPLMDEIATMKVDTGNMDVLRQMVKRALESGKNKNADGRDELAAWLESIAVGEKARAAADMYLSAKKAIIIFEKNTLSKDAARLVGNLTVLGGHATGPRDGVVQLLPGANSQGLSDLDILPGEAFLDQLASGEIRGMFVFGEDVPGVDLNKLEFLAVQDIHMTETAQKADVVFPASSFAETDGSYTSADGRARILNKAVEPYPAMDNSVQALELAALAGAPLGYRNAEDIRRAIRRKPIVKQAPRLAVPGGENLSREAVPISNELYAGFIEYTGSK